jgi:hypothetical protein
MSEKEMLLAVIAGDIALHGTKSFRTEVEK